MGLVYVLGGIMSGTRVCIGWYHEWDLSMYWVVSILPLPFFYWILEMFIQCSISYFSIHYIKVSGYYILTISSKPKYR